MAPGIAPLVTVERRPIAQLVHDLRALGDLRARADEVAARLDGLTLPLDRLLPALPFAKGRYTRTLVHRDARFELLLVAWSPGSAAPVHDHDGQDCWFVPLAGAFDLDDYGVSRGPGATARLVRLRSRRVGGGEVDRRDVNEAVHAVTPATPLALSLHVYARPLDRCRIYDGARGVWQWRALGYDGFARELGDG
jgi:cysteine dioxygenase